MAPAAAARQWTDRLAVMVPLAAVVALAEDASNYIAERLVAEEPHRLETFHVETDIVEIYRRLNTLTRRIARLSIDAGAAGASTAELGGAI